MKEIIAIYMSNAIVARIIYYTFVSYQTFVYVLEGVVMCILSTQNAQPF